MRLYDTASQNVREFSPSGKSVSIYTCGITPYDAAHMGHAAVYLTFDILQRRLQDLGFETKCVRNITDVDDSILGKARQLGVNYLDLAASEMSRFDRDMGILGLLKPYSEPRATSAIADILTIISKLLDSGHAYQAGGAVYFDVHTFDAFGQISHLDRDGMLKFASERGGNPDDFNKKDPLDFVLWQPSQVDEPSWDSLWGPGRPGWHIECSALAMRELGNTIDIHGGGGDLIFPHHECEAAQSESVTGEPFVKHWMHVAMVYLNGEKMSKSLGNLVFIENLLANHDPRAVRLAIVANHYRKPWEWNDNMIVTADSRLKKWLGSGKGNAVLGEVRSALDDDLDVPTAIDLIDDAVSKNLGVSEAAALLGVTI